jgi:hypothetical protein
MGCFRYIIVNTVHKGDNNDYDDDDDDDNNNNVTILSNQRVQTDRTIPNNKPEIIIRDDDKGTCTLIDVAVSGE